ncbi:MAG: 50S ribosomal protein L1 [Patescibacteria group bacterium]
MKKVDQPKSKRFVAAKKSVDPKKSYPIAEAIELAKKTSTVKFDATIEAHFRLGIDTKKSDQQVRSSVALPHGTGKTVRVAVIAADGDQQKSAKAAGADLVGEKDLVEEIKGGKINFDILVATPDGMKLLAPVAKILGPKGLMPNPKDGTVSANVGDVVAKLKKGKINFKNDDSGIIHTIIGKTSFETQKLVENFQTILEGVTRAKPSSAKGAYIKNITIASSMGPGIRVSL